MIIEFLEEKKNAELEAARRAIEELARRERTSTENVRAYMIEAMMTGWNDPDPKVQALWKQIPCEGERPTPEELIVWAKRQILNSTLS